MRRTLLLTCILSFSGICFAQEPCEKLLENGLYNHFKMIQKASFNETFKQYLLSDTFKQDLKSGSWGGSITVPIYGVPVTLGANASDEDFQTFKQKIINETNFSVSKEFLSVLITDVPNTDLAQIYSDCLHPPVGFTINTVPSDNNVIFVINFVPLDLKEPLPVVQSFSIISGSNVLDSGNIINNLQKDQTLNRQTIVTAKRDLKQDLVIALQTNKGSVYRKVAAESIEPNSEAPVGTVISSLLDFEHFNLATKNNELSPGGVWTSAKSKWAPADGRPVPRSRYETLASQPSVPDLRGVFMRGLNKFDPQQKTTVNNTQKNPEDKNVGEFQEDLFRQHNHNIPIIVHHGNWTYGGNEWAVQWTDQVPNRFDEGGAETRPKNISVYYYIRIN